MLKKNTICISEVSGDREKAESASNEGSIRIMRLKFATQLFSATIIQLKLLLIGTIFPHVTVDGCQYLKSELLFSFEKATIFINNDDLKNTHIKSRYM